MKYWQAPAWTSCRKAASWVSVVFQSRTKSISRPSASVKPATSTALPKACSESRAPGHIVDAPAAIGAEHFDGRDPLPEAGLRVGLDNGVEPGLERRDHRAVDGEGLVDRNRPVGERRDFQRTRHAADAGPVDFRRRDDGVGKGDLLAGEAGVFGLRAPDRPLGTAEESAARETQSRGQREQYRRNATRHDARRCADCLKNR